MKMGFPLLSAIAMVFFGWFPVAPFAAENICMVMRVALLVLWLRIALKSILTLGEFMFWCRSNSGSFPGPLNIEGRERISVMLVKFLLAVVGGRLGQKRQKLMTF